MKNIIVYCSFILTSVFAQLPVPLPETRGETRDKTYDVIHYKIEVSFDEAKKMVFGKTTTTFTPFLSNFSSVEFDAENMNFTSVKMGKKSLKFDSLAKSIKIYLDKPYSFNDTITLSIVYDCIPDKGVYFIQPDSAYPDKPSQIWTQGEAMDNHYWFPCWDFPNDKATSEVIGTVRSDYVFLSNGKLVSEKKDKKKGTTTFHWKQEKPHSSYLVMFAAGEYAVLKEKSDGIALEYYVYNHHVEDAKACYASTAPMIKFFNDYIGFRYPWEKYAQVIIADFMFGGMENTSATTLSDGITVYNARARVEESPTSLIAHEMAHQWWGDVVTAKDWKHLWLNESFASYYDPLYFEHAFGKDEFLSTMYSKQQSGINSDKTRGRKPIVSEDSYTSNIYPRGASVLHMLRFVLGDELFQKSIKHYITKYQFQPVETNDLKLAIEEATGQNLFWFFDQWIYKAGYPKFNVSYRYNDTTKTVSLSVVQTQMMDSLTGIFIAPVNVEVVSGGTSAIHRIVVSKEESTYVFPSTEKPSLVLFDKDNWLLKEVTYENRTTEEWAYQAEKGSDVVARMNGVNQLGTIDTTGFYISLLSSISKNDPFWAVRKSAVSALGMMKIMTEEKTDALLSALSDTHPDVRAEAAKQLGTISPASTNIADALRNALNDSSYTTEANALTSLAKMDSTNAIPLIKERIDKWSYRGRITNAAMNALASVDSVDGVKTALQKVKYGAEPLGRSTAMRVLRKYAAKNKDATETCVEMLTDKSAYMKGMAVTFLGDFGDESHLPALEGIAANTDDSAKDEALKAIAKIKKRSQ